MTDKEYTTGGEYPGPLHLTTCTGCRAPLSLGADGTLFCQNCGKPWAEDGLTPEARAMLDPDAPSFAEIVGNGIVAVLTAANSAPPRIAPDEVRVSRADLQALLDGAVHANRYNDMYVCECCKETWPDWGNSRHADDCVVKRLAAASGDDGGTP